MVIEIIDNSQRDLVEGILWLYSITPITYTNKYTNKIILTISNKINPHLNNNLKLEIKWAISEYKVLIHDHDDD